MPANLQNSDRAIQDSIRIVDICVRMREFVLANKELLLKVEALEKRIGLQELALVRPGGF